MAWLIPLFKKQKIASVKENLVKIYTSGEEFKALDVSLSDYDALSAVYEADKGGSPVGYIYETAAQGYGGEVKTLIALDKDGTYKDYRFLIVVVKHQVLVIRLLVNHLLIVLLERILVILLIQFLVQLFLQHLLLKELSGNTAL